MLQKVQQRSAYLYERLMPLLAHRNVGDVRIKGMAGAVELVACRETRERFPWHERVGHQVCGRMIAAGVWTRPLGNVIVVMPPLCISESELDFFVDVLSRAIEQQFD